MSFARVVATVSMAILMANIDATIVYIALPTISVRFAASTGDIARVVTGYLLFLCGFLLIAGQLADRLGSRRVLAGGYALFTVASFFCGVAPNLWTLVACRCLQGLGGAMIFATSNAVVAQYLPEETHGRAYGILAVFGSLGVALGAPVGGFLVHYLDWRWVFFVNVPAGLLGAWLALKMPRRNTLPAHPRGRFDLSGAALSLVCLAALIAALNQGGVLGWHSPKVLGLFGMALVAGVAFFLREKRASSPLLDLSALSNRYLLAGLAGNFACMMILDGFSFVFPFYFSLVRGLNPDRIGLLLMVFPIVSAVLGSWVGRLTDQRGPRAVALVSGVGMTAATLLFALFGERAGLPLVLGAFALFGAAMAGYFTAISSLIMGHAPEGEEGMASGVLSLDTFLGSTLGVCLFEALFSAPFAGAPAENAAPLLVLAGYSRAAWLGAGLGLATLIAAVLSRQGRKTAGI